MYSHEQEKHIMTMTLYHGTDAQYLDNILKNGIVPRGTSKGNWEHADLYSNPDLVYLTDCYAFYYSTMQVTEDQKDSLILKIEVDESKLCLDEDLIMQLPEKGRRNAFERIVRTNKRFGVVSRETSKWSKFKNKDMKHQHRFFSDYIKYFRSEWDMSLEHLGTVAHIGKIEPSQIKDYVTHDFLPCLLSHDNSVTIENHRWKSDYQRAELKYLFDEPLDERDKNAIEDNKYKQKELIDFNKECEEKKRLDLSKSETKLLVNN
jgi:hypothetical protein